MGLLFVYYGYSKSFLWEYHWIPWGFLWEL